MVLSLYSKIVLCTNVIRSFDASKAQWYFINKMNKKGPGNKVHIINDFKGELDL